MGKRLKYQFKGGFPTPEVDFLSLEFLKWFARVTNHYNCQNVTIIMCMTAWQCRYIHVPPNEASPNTTVHL